MGCICSFFRALTSYHGSHLTAHQVSRQRQQRARKAPQPSPPPPSSAPDPVMAKESSKGAGPGVKEEERLLTFTPQKQKLAECGKQSSFSHSKFSTSFAKS